MSLSEKTRKSLKSSLPVLEIALCQKEYAFYVEYAHRPIGGNKSNWLHSKHLDFVCKKIQAFIEVDTGHAFDILILSMPPQHGKSMSVTETLPSWYLGKYPEKRIILASYNDDTAERFCRRNKEKIKAVGANVWGIKIGEVDRATDFELAGHQGRMISRGLMSGITSNPAELVLIDDPLKNRQEADSDTYRDRQWEEWLNTIKTRLAAKSKVILINTRWHEDDLAGRIIANEKNVTVINLPCEAEEDDPLGRNVGDALFPEIGKNNEWLREFKAGYQTAEGSRAWSALFQGHPSYTAGNLLKRSWWKFYTEMPKQFDQILQSWDMTFKDSDGSDYVSGQVWGNVGANIYMLPDREYGRMDFVATLTAFKRLSDRNPKAIIKLVEDKANGSAVIAMLQNKIRGIIPVNPKGSKIARVSAVSPLIEAGNVYLPAPSICPWINSFIEECTSFPNAAKDDQVDSMSQSLQRLMYSRNAFVETPNPLKWDRGDKPKYDIFWGGDIDTSFINFT